MPALFRALRCRLVIRPRLLIFLLRHEGRHDLQLRPRGIHRLVIQREQGEARVAYGQRISRALAAQPHATLLQQLIHLGGQGWGWQAACK